MAKTKESQEIEKIEESQEVQFEVTIDEKGRYIFPEFEMYINEEDESEVIKLTVQKMLNLGLYNTALYAYSNSGDPRAFGQAVFKNMIVYPKKCQSINFWDHDPEALAMVATAMTELMGKKKKTLKRNLNFSF